LRLALVWRTENSGFKYSPRAHSGNARYGLWPGYAQTKGNWQAVSVSSAIALTFYFVYFVAEKKPHTNFAGTQIVPGPWFRAVKWGGLHPPLPACNPRGSAPCGASASL